MHLLCQSLCTKDSNLRTESIQTQSNSRLHSQNKGQACNALEKLNQKVSRTRPDSPLIPLLDWCCSCDSEYLTENASDKPTSLSRYALLIQCSHKLSHFRCRKLYLHDCKERRVKESKVGEAKGTNMRRMPHPSSLLSRA